MAKTTETSDRALVRNGSKPRSAGVIPMVPELPNLEEIRGIAELLYQSGYFADVKDMAQAAVKVLYGREVGLGPLMSMKEVHIVKGKPGLSAHAMAARIRQCGYDYRVVEHTHTVCRIEFLARDGRLSGVSEFTLEDARRADLAGSATWKAWPKNMLYARAMSNGAKWYAADAFGGSVYTPEELAESEDLGGPGPAIVVTPAGLTPAQIGAGTASGEDMVEPGSGAPVAPAAATVPGAEDPFGEEPAVAPAPMPATGGDPGADERGLLVDAIYGELAQFKAQPPVDKWARVTRALCGVAPDALLVADPGSLHALLMQLRGMRTGDPTAKARYLEIVRSASTDR